jgi:triosephosphate isomerase
MRNTLVAGNWKLNGSADANSSLLAGITAGLDSGSAASEVMVCPPYVYLAAIAAQLAGTDILLAAQDVSPESGGAFTGEVAAAMLRDVGASHALVGHSERRTLYGDTDAVVAAKFQAAQAGGLTPVLCLGESLEHRRAGATMDIIDQQLGGVLEAAGAGAFANAIVAYEPVWAIGTGMTATPEQAQEVHLHIRGIITGADAKIGADLQILYGGSVKAANAAELFALEDIDGGLIGGASLQAAEFLSICKAAAGTN